VLQGETAAAAAAAFRLTKVTDDTMAAGGSRLPAWIIKANTRNNDQLGGRRGWSSARRQLPFEARNRWRRIRRTRPTYMYMV